MINFDLFVNIVFCLIIEVKRLGKDRDDSSQDSKTFDWE